MMLLLPGDISLHLFEVRLTHGKIRVAALPFKIREIAATPALAENNIYLRTPTTLYAFGKN